MPKALCLTGLVIAILVLLLFVFDLIVSLAGQGALSPFRGTSISMDVIFMVCAGMLAYLSWSAFRELK
jgi:hypothetical protein